ncbi:DUF551 domain-containing protein [Sphingobacterium sp. UBA2074]|uniref:DUF551 domain-containing protein n=1 Tax=Sphingobacterium sp. UBA2074 TaxID=1947487 RepID=UPI00257F8460|nr:DUF551 domain-containing protein [Sphingobacterium sp. UBA2074]
MTWIPVNEEIPELGLCVLVALKSGLMTVAYLKDINGKKAWQLYGPIQDYFDLKTESVTDWQYLPKPPKQK